MNNVSLIGRTTKEIELIGYKANKKETGHLAKFTLAIPRRSNHEESDFIPCVAFGKTAEIISEHITKGMRIGILGHIQTGSYEKEDGTRVYTTDVIVDSFTFADTKKEDVENQKSSYNKKYK